MEIIGAGGRPLYYPCCFSAKEIQEACLHSNKGRSKSHKHPPLGIHSFLAGDQSCQRSTFTQKYTYTMHTHTDTYLQRCILVPLLYQFDVIPLLFFVRTSGCRCRCAGRGTRPSFCSLRLLCLFAYLLMSKLLLLRYPSHVQVGAVYGHGPEHRFLPCLTYRIHTCVCVCVRVCEHTYVRMCLYMSDLYHAFRQAIPPPLSMRISLDRFQIGSATTT
jgi:hypothetical protein